MTKRTNKLIPDMIWSYRMDHNLSQKELGEKIGVSHAAVSDLERGITNHLPIILIEMLFCEGWEYRERRYCNTVEEATTPEKLDVRSLI